MFQHFSDTRCTLHQITDPVTAMDFLLKFVIPPSFSLGSTSLLSLLLLENTVYCSMTEITTQAHAETSKFLNYKEFNFYRCFDPGFKTETKTKKTQQNPNRNQKKKEGKGKDLNKVLPLKELKFWMSHKLISVTLGDHFLCSYFSNYQFSKGEIFFLPCTILKKTGKPISFTIFDPKVEDICI